jgi:membrane fusion protein, multidrug efflux system
MTTPSSVRRNVLLIGVPILMLCGGAIWFLTHPAATKAQPRAAPAAILVTTARVVQQTVPVYLTGIGTVTAKESVTIRARIDGQLDKINFEEGQDIKAGELVAQLDPRVQQAQLEQAQAQKAKDQAQLANAELDLRRYAALMKQDATTRQIYDAQRSLVAQSKAAVQSDDAQISYAATQLSFTRITAPISGRAGARLVDPGNIVHANDANGLVVINQIDPITVVFTLPEESFQAINNALRASARPLTVIAYARNSNEPLGEGSLILLNNQIDTSTGTVQLKGLFSNPRHTLWPGQYVNAKLILGQRAQALTVPAAVVQRGPDGPYAYVVDAADTARIAPIDVGTIQDGTAIINKGLKAGERVVLDGQYKLKPGLKIIDSATQPAAAPAASGSSRKGSAS